MDLNNACVHPNIVRLPFANSNGHYIDIKDRLNAGELEDLHATWQPLIKGGRGVEMQTRAVRFAKVEKYLLGWSLMDGGAPIPIDNPAALRGALDNLAPEIFTAIHRMIEAHETTREAEVEEQTKNPTGSPDKSETSPSVEP